MSAQRPLWTCPRCGNVFTTRNQQHSCGTWPLAPHFEGRPQLRALFDRLIELTEQHGPVRVVPQRTRIAVMDRVRFLAVYPRARHLRLGLYLTEEHPGPPVVKIERYGPRAFVHVIELRAEDELVDPAFRALLRAAYAVGRQDHLA